MRPTGTLTVIVGQSALGKRDGIAGEAQDLAVDTRGNLFFADIFPGARPQNVSCQIRERVASTGRVRAVVGGTEHGPATPAERFVMSTCESIGVGVRDTIDVVTSHFPWGRDPLRLYRFDPLTGRVHVVAGCDRCYGFHAGEPGTKSMVQNNDDLVVDRDGSAIIADGTGGALWRVSTGGVVSRLAADVCIKPQWVPHTCPRMLALSPDAVYFTDSNERVERLSLRTHRVSVVAGGGHCRSRQQAFCGNDIPATRAKLDGPQDIAVDAHDNLYIADTVVQRVDSHTHLIRVIAGNGSLPGSTPHLPPGTRVPATTIPLEPVALATGPNGTVYIADANLGVLAWSAR